MGLSRSGISDHMTKSRRARPTADKLELDIFVTDYTPEKAVQRLIEVKGGKCGRSASQARHSSLQTQVPTVLDDGHKTSLDEPHWGLTTATASPSRGWAVPPDGR
jgi:hypothetical protein